MDNFLQLMTHDQCLSIALEQSSENELLPADSYQSVEAESTHKQHYLLPKVVGNDRDSVREFVLLVVRSPF